MPRNNLKARRVPGLKIDRGHVAVPPAGISVKSLQDALVDGYERPSQWARDFLDLDPYDKQIEFLDRSRDVVEANFVAGNRVGKTWVAGLVLLWRAFYRFISPHTAPEKRSPHAVYKAVSTSLTHDQAKLAWSYALAFANGSKRFRPFLADAVHSPFPTMILQVRNERGDLVPSEVWARSLAKGGVYLLGHSLGYVHVDECAYVRGYPKIEDEVLRMRLADQGGSLFRFSTPNGRNFFYDLYQKGLSGDPRYFSYRITSHDNPYISKAFLAEQQARMAPDFYAQNILGEFVSLSDFFRMEAIQRLFDNVEYELPVPRNAKGRYALGADLGAQRDPTVVFVLRIDQKPHRLVYVGELRNASWKASREFVASVYNVYQPEKAFVDATGVGAPIVQQLIDDDGLAVTPFVFSHTSKPDALTRLQDAVQQGAFVFPYTAETSTLVNQLSFYRLDDREIEQDYVLALSLANLATEAALKEDSWVTEYPDELAALSVVDGGYGVSADLVGEGPGQLFYLDEATGLFLPRT